MAHRLLLAVTLGGALIAVPTVPAAAATFTVTKVADTNDGACDADCSLREGIVAANAAPGADTIVVPAGTYTLARSGIDDAGANGDVDIVDDVTLTGAGAGVTVLEQTVVDRVLHVVTGAATITGVTITGGNATLDVGTSMGGGIFNTGTLVVADSIIEGNDANSGGGIHSFGTATVRRTTVRDNHALNVGFVNNRGGGLKASSGSLQVVDSLVTGNTTTMGFGAGGGIAANPELSPNPTVSVVNTTVHDNTAGAGGGVFVENASGTIANTTITDNEWTNTGRGGISFFTPGGQTLTVRNTIVAGNEAPACGGNALTSTAGNVEDTNTCGFDHPNTDPLLEPLGDNGGPTLTRALPAGSPALGIGTGCEATDQRGAPRTAPCDSGAYERELCRGILLNRVGTDSPDTLTGTDGADGILGGAGGDVVTALGGDDAACLGAGNDRASGGDGNDLLDGEAGKDRLNGGSGNDRLEGDQGNDRLTGASGRDRLVCGPGKKDVGRGGPGRDRAAKCELGKA